MTALQTILALSTWVQLNWVSILECVTSLIGTASLIVKITPTLRDDHVLLHIVKFIGKYIALDKYGPTDRPKQSVHKKKRKT
jgi:hypothetical protein